MAMWLEHGQPCKWSVVEPLDLGNKCIDSEELHRCRDAGLHRLADTKRQFAKSLVSLDRCETSVKRAERSHLQTEFGDM